MGGLGPKTYELAAGFLRIRDGAHPLDGTGVHPERYKVVEAMAKQLRVSLEDLTGNPSLAARIDYSGFIDEQQGLGEYTLADIRTELEQPGRDPRPDFKVPEWREDVVRLDDLEPGMRLEGRVSNVTNFRAFVDIGVKQDGLVHVSELSHKWIADPQTAVQVGQVVTVAVMSVDRERGRIALSMKSLEPAPAKTDAGRPDAGRENRRPSPMKKAEPPRKAEPTMEDLLRKCNKRR